MKCLKRILTVLIIVVALLSLGTAEASVEINETNFPDEEFRDYVSYVDKDKDGTLSDTEISGVTFISVGYSKIQSLKGIEFFTALNTLYCYNNQLTALDVSKNTNLTSLRCSYNQLTVLDVSNNINLTDFRCRNNELTALDVSKNTKLTSLWCRNNELTALDVSNNTNLTDLRCSYNQLTVLDVSNNINLTYLSCYDNQLTALDVSRNTDLTSLHCENNQLAALDVSKNANLTTLSCEYNQLTALDVSKNINLTSLHCYANELTALDVSNNINLITLWCENNQLTALDVSKNTDLIYFYCNAQTPKGLKYSQTPPSKFYDICLKDYIDVSKIKSGSVKCYNEYGGEISSTYDAFTGYVTTSSIPDYVYYEYDTGYKSKYMDVKFYVDSEAEVPEALKLNVDFPSTGTVGVSYSGSATVTGGTSPYTWTYDGFPDGITVKTSEATLEASGIPEKAGTYSIKLSVKDSKGQSITQNVTIKINKASTPDPEPVIEELEMNANFSKSGTVGESYVGKATLTGGTSPYKWKQSGNIPTGLELKTSGATATLKGYPTEAGKFTFTLKATDSNKQTVSQKITVKIVKASTPDPEVEDLVIETDFEDSGKVGEYYYGKATVTGGTAPYDWDYEQDMPDGLALKSNNNSVTVSGIPEEAGEYTFILVVTDSKGNTEDAVITIVIDEDPILPLEIDDEDFEPLWAVKNYYSGTAKAINGVAPYEWSFEGELPPGLELSDPIDDEWAEVEIAGKPVKAGEYSFTLIVTDSTGDSEEITVDIKITTPKISGSLTKTGMIKKTYTSSVNVSGGTAPYKWSVSSGTLPAGLKLKYDKSTGKATVTGKPSKADSYTFKLKVADTNKASATKSYTVKITAPEIGGTLPAGVVKKTYKGTLTASGGQSPYIWSINTTPDGLEFSQNAKGTKAYLKGKPTTAKSYTVKLTLTDANKAKTTKKFTFKIAKKSTSTSNSLIKNENGFEGVLNVETMTGEFTPLTELSIFEEDILSKGEGKDEDLVTVKADKPLRFAIGEWPVEVSRNEIKVLIDDEVNDEIEISDENTFTISSELVRGDFKVKAEAGEFESNEIFVSAAN